MSPLGDDVVRRRRRRPLLVSTRTAIDVWSRRWSLVDRNPSASISPVFPATERSETERLKRFHRENGASHAFGHYITLIRNRI